jgi:hypothetical protein
MMASQGADAVVAAAKAVPVAVTVASVSGFGLQQGVYLLTIIWTALLISGWVYDRLIKGDKPK